MENSSWQISYALAILRLCFLGGPAMKSHLAHGHNNVAIKLESVN